MKLLIINQQQIPELLPMRDCIELMSQTLRTLSSGGAILPLRNILRLPGGQNAFAAMPAFMDTPAAMGVKVVSVFPHNHGTALDSHQGAVLLFDTSSGRLLAVMDASSITAIRTAAVSAVATRHLSRPDSVTLTLLGSGVQARTHFEAMLTVRPFREVRVWSRNADNCTAFAADAAAVAGNTVRVVVHQSAQSAVDGADVVCTVTSAREPVLRGEWLQPGTHVNAVGTSMPSARELDATAIARARLFVDRVESAVNEAGEYIMALKEGAITEAHIVAELGDVLLGTKTGRQSTDEITVFKSLGLAVEDIAAAHHVFQRAIQLGQGVSVEFGGGRA